MDPEPAILFETAALLDGGFAGAAAEGTGDGEVDGGGEGEDCAMVETNKHISRKKQRMEDLDIVFVLKTKNKSKNQEKNWG